MKVLEPLTYWRSRGRVYERDFRPAKYREQEQALEAVLGELAFESVLDVGCGFGRIGELVFRLRPELATYVGLDISTDQLEAARRRLPKRAWLVAGDIRRILWSETAAYDLVLAVEVLMHVPPADIEAVTTVLRRLARRELVTCDWDAPGAAAGGYCWGHDYAALLPGAEKVPVGGQAIWIWRP